MAADNRAGLAPKTGAIAPRAGAIVRSGAVSRVPVEAIARVVAATDHSAATDRNSAEIDHSAEIDFNSGATDRSTEEPPRVEVGRRGRIHPVAAGAIGVSEESHRRSFTMSQRAPVRWRKWSAG